MQIKDMSQADRPQEKLLFCGASKLSNSELLALIIRTGNRNKSAVQLAEDVLSYSSTVLGKLQYAEVTELTEIDGIGVSKACAIVASLELSKRISEEKSEERKYLTSPKDAAFLVMESVRHEKREHLIELLLNAKCEITSKETISIGELSSTTVHPREVFAPAIRKGAAGIIVVHNHPSGDPTPSAEDIATTKRLMEVSNIIGIKLVDHIIIGDGNYISLKNEGVIT